MKLKFKVEEKNSGKEIREILAKEHEMSSSLIKKIRLYGSLSIDGKPGLMIDRALAGQTILAELYDGNETESLTLPSRGKVEILYCDAHLAVAFKPSNMVMHPVAGHREGTLLDLYKDFKLHQVMRLDRLTSGLIILARDPYTHNTLSLAGQRGEILKEYRGICHGVFKPQKGKLQGPIKRRQAGSMLRHVHISGKDSVTAYENLSNSKDGLLSYMKFILHTGRTHQIRVHCLHRGHPLLGDNLYGPASNENRHYSKALKYEKELDRLALHAHRIEFIHPVSKKEMAFTSPVPPAMEVLLRKHFIGQGHSLTGGNPP